MDAVRRLWLQVLALLIVLMLAWSVIPLKGYHLLTRLQVEFQHDWERLGVTG